MVSLANNLHKGYASTKLLVYYPFGHFNPASVYDTFILTEFSHAYLFVDYLA